MALSELLLVNPRHKKRRKAAKSRRHVRHVAKRAKRRSRRRAVGYTIGSSPVRRRKLNPRRRRHHVARRRHRYARNPRFSIGSLKTMVMPAITGAVGAVVLDIGLTYVPLPASLQTGWGKTAVQAAGAVALGMLASKFLGRSKGAAVGLGALTIVSYGVVKNLAHQFLPSVPGLSGDYADMGVGAYMPNMGWVNPAATLGAYMSSGGGGLSELQRMQMGCMPSDDM